MEEVLGTLVRTVLVYAVLLVLARVLGKKQMSQLTFFHYITGITLGSIAGSIISSDNGTYADEFAGIITVCALTVLMGEVNLRFESVRTLVEGEPAILIRNGNIDKKQMDKSRTSIAGLNMMLREKGIFSMLDVEYAILETSGKFSVMKRQDQSEASGKDVKAGAGEAGYLPRALIVWGRIDRVSLREKGLDEEWLKERLKEQGIGSEKEVLYAELQKDGTLHVQKDGEG
ncbi:MAG TPA: DUF421 domain-containing protein [Candidatus Limnocylindria bacterium]|nr:DUF421 domain-containing protein [Candidatus Limnocylindria bacterium]